VTGNWQDLALMLEPVKWYGRLLGAAALEARINGIEMPQSRPYGVLSALNGLVDCLPPESRPARKLASLCQQVDRSDPEGNQTLRRILQSWQALADQAQAAPAGLSEPARKLGLLADLIAARIDGETANTDSALSEICAPSGELIISVPPGLRDWLAC
jgi:hypothetical protein